MCLYACRMFFVNMYYACLYAMWWPQAYDRQKMLDISFITSRAKASSLRPIECSRGGAPSVVHHNSQRARAATLRRRRQLCGSCKSLTALPPSERSRLPPNNSNRRRQRRQRFRAVDVRGRGGLAFVYCRT